MDIRNFFTKKVDKENGGALKGAKAVPPEASTSTEKNSVKPRPTSNGAASSSSKRSRNRDVVAVDDDDVVVIESPLKNKGMKPSNIKSAKPSVPKTAAAVPKASTRPAKTNDIQIFLDDSSFENDNEIFATAKKSPPKKQKVIESLVPVSVKSASPSIARSSPRTRKLPPTTDLTLHESQSVKKRAPMPSKSRITSEPRPVVLQPSLSQDVFNVNQATPQCLVGLTFCLSGIMPNLSRDEASEMIKILGGRVTTAVSSKTTYLVLGDILEDGRSVEEGSKYVRATAPDSTTILIRGMDSFYGLLQQYSDSKGSSEPSTISNTSVQLKPPPVTLEKSVVSGNGSQISSSTSVPAVVPKSNPYATATTSTTVASNPYARKSNPYAKKPAMAATTKPTTASTMMDDRKMPAKIEKGNADMTQLWVDKYKPSHSSEILGNQDAVRKLSVWLASWEDCFNSSNNKVKSFSAPNGPWKAALLSGPPGIGKTTTATLVAKESGRDVLEFNASDVRSKKAMQEAMGDITGSHTLEFRTSKAQQQHRTKRCIIMDEVDGMGAGDRSGMSELIQMIKASRVPIVCICNDRQSQKMKSLLPYCMDLRYRRPTKAVIANRAVHVARLEGLAVEQNAAEAIVESCGNDVRQVINCLQMWSSSSSNSMTYKDLKERENSINKDEILRVSLFDAARVIVEGRKGLIGSDMLTQRNHFFHRNDAYYVDYNFLGLLVQQNYLKVMQPQFNDVKRQNDNQQIGSFLDRMHSASMSMSDWAVMDGSLHMDMNWSLLPATAALAVKTGYHAGGENGGMLGGFPEFTTWLGRNSTRNKKVRIMNELCHHMNYKISAGTTEMRISYLPLLRARFLAWLTSDGTEPIQEAIELMDEYGLDRDDVFEKLDEFNIDASGKETKGSFQKIDSKKKAAFTRLYNQGSHRSQALVAEQGAVKKNRRASSSGMTELDDPEAIDDDVGEVEPNEDDDEDEDEQDMEKIRAAFQKKGSRAAAKKATAASKKKK